MFASFIIGYPGETADTIKETIDFIEATRPDFYRAELYYHDTNAPVAKRTEEFGIRRAGYSWSHSTMDWREAAHSVDTIYRTVSSSIILPLYTYDFWAMPYLLSRGISLDQFTKFTAIAHEMMVNGLSSEHPNHSAQEAKLMTLFGAPPTQQPAVQVVHG
jgi:p-methyltransferase